MTNIPEHLQKKIVEREIDFARFKQNSGKSIYDISYMRYGFEQGASAMHSIMLEEMKVVVEALVKAIDSADFFSRHADCTKESWACKCEFCRDTKSTINLREARQALSHYREKIEGVK